MKKLKLVTVCTSIALLAVGCGSKEVEVEETTKVETAKAIESTVAEKEVTEEAKEVEIEEAVEGLEVEESPEQSESSSTTASVDDLLIDIADKYSVSIWSFPLEVMDFSASVKVKETGEEIEFINCKEDTYYKDSTGTYYLLHDNYLQYDEESGEVEFGLPDDDIMWDCDDYMSKFNYTMKSIMTDMLTEDDKIEFEDNGATKKFMYSGTYANEPITFTIVFNKDLNIIASETEKYEISNITYGDLAVEFPEAVVKYVEEKDSLIKKAE